MNRKPKVFPRFLILAALLAMPSRAQFVADGGSETVTLSVGSAAGVRDGMTGKVCAPEMVGGRPIENCFARFVIVSTHSQSATAKITKGSGRAIRRGALARFDLKLVPPAEPRPKERKKTPEAKPPRKDESSAILHEADRAFEEGDWLGARERYQTFLKRFADHSRAAEAALRVDQCRKELDKIALGEGSSAPAGTASSPVTPTKPTPAVAESVMPASVIEAEQYAVTAERMFDAGNLVEARAAATEALRRDSTNSRARGMIERVRARSVLSRLNRPSGVSATADGCVVADGGNNIVRKVTATETRTIAGAAGEFGSNDGPSGLARFNDPCGVAVADDGSIYIADRYNATIRRLSPEGRVTTVAGKAGAKGIADGTAASSSRFTEPCGIALWNAAIYVADAGSHSVRRILANGTVDTLLSSEGSERMDPAGVAVGPDGSVYVADRWNHTIVKIDASGRPTLFAGVEGAAGTLDGPAVAARFNAPEGVAVDEAGDVYVADSGNDIVRKIADGMVTTVAGKAGVAGALDGVGGAARFSEPSGIACGQGGAIWIADRGNHTIRMLVDGFVSTISGLAGVPGDSDGAN